MEDSMIHKYIGKGKNNGDFNDSYTSQRGGFVFVRNGADGGRSEKSGRQ